MLSGETASGKYPAEALQTMVRTVEEAERHIDYQKRFREEHFSVDGSVTNAISHAGCAAAFDLKANAILTVTHAGKTARMISRFKPSCPICAATVSEKVCRQLRLSWGVYPTMTAPAANTDEMCIRDSTLLISLQANGNTALFAQAAHFAQPALSKALSLIHISSSVWAPTAPPGR